MHSHPVKLCDSWGVPCDGCQEPPAHIRAAAQAHEGANTSDEIWKNVSHALVTAIVVLAVLQQTQGRGTRAQGVGVVVGIAVSFGAMVLLHAVVGDAGSPTQIIWATLPFAVAAGVASGR